MPVRVLKKIEKLSKETGESAERIVESAIDSYAKKKATLTRGNDRLAELMKDPKQRVLLKELTSAMASRANSKMSDEERKARSKKGGEGRADSLSAERRKEISRAGALARWGRRDEQLKAKESGSKKPPRAKQ
jgi:hypothetical protein